VDLSYTETQLKKRRAYPYRWHRVQNNRFDHLTDFVYGVEDFDSVLEHMRRQFSGTADYQAAFDYALNRWYNFWSAAAVEHIFQESSRVIPALNHRDRLVDFSIDGIEFDHKTSVFAKGYRRSLEYATGHPENLIEWLYANQSQQQRKHTRNRLFIVLHSSDGQHWKLKAEISWLHTIINNYLLTFSADAVHRFQFSPAYTTLSDIIWGIR